MFSAFREWFSFKKIKRNLHILRFGEDNSLNKEVPDLKGETAPIPDPGSQMLVL